MGAKGHGNTITMSTGGDAPVDDPTSGKVHFKTVPELYDCAVAMVYCFYPDQKSEVVRYVIPCVEDILCSVSYAPRHNNRRLVD